jgi:putative PIG3 family NAD(P)H quinone oxidoreductase
MKAVVIASHGGVESLEIREVQDPAPATADRVRIRVRAAGVNRADVLQRMGRYPAPPGYPQEIPGLEFAGEIESVGPEVRQWQPGQRVFGITGGGANAEFVVSPEDTLAEIPTNLDWIQAAAVPEVFITAYDALFTQARLTLGETVLVHAAGSGVGTAAVQLAHVAGARVFGTSRTADKLERAKAFGLDGCAVVHDDPAQFVAAINEWTNNRGVDVVLDLVGAAYLQANLESLALNGRMMFVGTTSGAKATLDLSTVMRKRLSINGTVLRPRSLAEKASATRLFARHVIPLLATGEVRPIVDSCYKLSEVRAAHQRIESNGTFGKVVLVLD